MMHPSDLAPPWPDLRSAMRKLLVLWRVGGQCRAATRAGRTTVDVAGCGRLWPGYG
jgi:hypothetical protein